MSVCLWQIVHMVQNVFGYHIRCASHLITTIQQAIPITPIGFGIIAMVLRDCTGVEPSHRRTAFDQHL